MKITVIQADYDKAVALQCNDLSGVLLTNVVLQALERCTRRKWYTFNGVTRQIFHRPANNPWGRVYFELPDTIHNFDHFVSFEFETPD